MVLVLTILFAFTALVPLDAVIASPPYPLAENSVDHLFAIAENGRSDEELLCLDTLAGNLARKRPQLYRVSKASWEQDKSQAYSSFLIDMKHNLGIIVNNSLVEAPLQDIVAEFKLAGVTGYIRSGSKDASTSAALTLAAASDGLLVAANDEVAKALHTAGLSQVKDLRKKKVSDVLQESLSNLSKRIFVFQDASKIANMGDYAVFARAPTMEFASDEPAQEAFLKRAESPGVALGWHGENDFVSTLSGHGIYVHAADWSKNLAALSNVASPNITRRTQTMCTCTTPCAGTGGHNQYNCDDDTVGYCASTEECYATSGFEKGKWSDGCRKPKPMCACTTPRAGTVGHNEYKCNDGTVGYCASTEECYATRSFPQGKWSNGCRVYHPGDAKHTVAFLMSDGDNIQWTLGGWTTDTGRWGSPDRGTVPLGWTFSPGSKWLAPRVLQHVISTATTNDELVSGPSGIGYIFPRRWPSAVLTEFAALTHDGMKAAGMTVVNVLGQDDSDPSVDVLTTWLTDDSPGMVYYPWGDGYSHLQGRVWFSGDKPIVSGRVSLWGESDTGLMLGVNGLIKKLKTLPKDTSKADGYSLIPVNAWSHNYSDVVTVVKALNDAGGFDVVLPSELLRRLSDVRVTMSLMANETIII